MIIDSRTNTCGCSLSLSLSPSLPPSLPPHTHTHTHTHTLQSGLLVVWKVDSHGQLHPVPLHQHRLHAPLTHCEMLHPISAESTKGGGSVLENFTWERKSAALMAMSIQDPIACFCATIDGTIHAYIIDEPVCVCVCVCVCYNSNLL